MLELSTPRGLLVQVPETPAEDPSPRFSVNEMAAIGDYYRENGYVIVRSLFPAETCDSQRRLWDEEVKPFGGYIYRQATAKAEKHVFNQNGWVMNPILNLQSVDPKRFPRFRRHATESVLASPDLRDVFAGLLGELPKVVQSMYFEGNSATWEHQDSYYLDSEKVGEMAAAWIAIEDIAAQAGRFFICPGSHKFKLDEHGLENNIAEHHEVYISSVVTKIKIELGNQGTGPAKGRRTLLERLDYPRLAQHPRFATLTLVDYVPRHTEFAFVPPSPNTLVGRCDRYGEQYENFSPQGSRDSQESANFSG